MNVRDNISFGLRMRNVLQVDKPYDLYEEPKTRFVADFIGETNFVNAVVTENVLEIYV